MNEDKDILAQRLTEHGYAALLGEYPNQLLVESVRSEPDIARRLLGIVNNPGASWQARFMAAEFLFRRVDMTLHSRFDRASLQESYFQALVHNYTGNGADWGFEKGPNDLGALGYVVASWGKEVEAFRRGLDDGRIVTINFPWRTPSHFSPPYRVKDFAALIIAKAHGMGVDLAGSPDERDKVIAGLKRTLANP